MATVKTNRKQYYESKLLEQQEKEAEQQLLNNKG